MRNVIFRKRVRIDGTNKYELSEYIFNGKFHQWGCSYEEFESGAGNFTVALIEIDDGTIEEVLPSNLKFTH